MTLVSIRTKRDSSPIWRNFSPVKREDWEEPLQFLRTSSLRIGRMLERLVRGLRAPEGLEFVIISLPLSWLFAVIAGSRRVSFRNLPLLELKIKIFSR